MGAFIGLGLNINMNGSAALGGAAGGGSPPPTVYVFDSFNRPDNPTSLGVADTGQTWTSFFSTWGISNNAAIRVAGDAGAQVSVVVNSGVSDCSVSAVFKTITTESRLVFRVQDGQNLFQVKLSATSYALRRIVAGAVTQIGTFGTTPANGDVITARLNGAQIDILLNGVGIISVSDATFQTETKHGLASFSSGTNEEYDSFRVEALS